MSPWFEAALAKYGWIWIGLTFGLAAKYALLIKRGVKLRMQIVAADLLLLPLVALISYSIISRLGADGEMAALMTALSTVGADRVVKLYTDRWMGRIESEVRAISQEARGEVRQEIQAELSGQQLRADIREGRTPDEYAALKRRPTTPP